MLVVTLYVRDAVGLPGAGDPALPPLDPSVPETHDPIDAGRPEELRPQWTAWWQSLLMGRLTESECGPPGYTGLAAWPDLRLTLSRHFDAARTYAQARKEEHIELMIGSCRGAVETNLVRDLEDRLRRRVPGFDLRVDELPVVGVTGWRIGHEHVLVTRGLLADPAANREWLTPVVIDPL